MLLGTAVPIGLPKIIVPTTLAGLVVPVTFILTFLSKPNPNST